MLPNPLHPAVVHFPIVFTVLLPLVLVGALWVIKRGTAPRRAWMFAVGAAAALSLSAWLATQTGEAQEEAVENLVPETALDTHEAAADRFVILSLGILVITAAGLTKGRAGAVARGAALVGALGLTIAGYQVGHSGGALVYQYGAGNAAARGSQGETRQTTRDAVNEDHDRDEAR